VENHHEKINKKILRGENIITSEENGIFHKFFLLFFPDAFPWPSSVHVIMMIHAFSCRRVGAGESYCARRGRSAGMTVGGCAF
jgi:hypothetical protein